MKTYLVDANIFLRLLLNDVPAQTNKAKKVITKAKEGKIKLVTSQIIIFEVVFALSKYFDFPKAKVALALEYIIESQYFNLESKKDFYVFKMFVICSLIKLFLNQKEIVVPA